MIKAIIQHLESFNKTVNGGTYGVNFLLSPVQARPLVQQVQQVMSGQSRAARQCAQWEDPQGTAPQADMGLMMTTTMS
jgi:hypothetical protein